MECEWGSEWGGRVKVAVINPTGQKHLYDVNGALMIFIAIHPLSLFVIVNSPVVRETLPIVATNWFYGLYRVRVCLDGGHGTFYANGPAVLVYSPRRVYCSNPHTMFMLGWA